MLITVRVPDDKAAFFKKMVSIMSFDVTKTAKEVDKNIASKEDKIIESTRKGLQEYVDYKKGKTALMSLEDFKKELEINS